MMKIHLIVVVLVWTWTVHNLHAEIPSERSDDTVPPQTQEVHEDDRANPILTTGSRFLPTFVSVRIARSMDPETVAQLAVSVPVSKAVAITKGLDRDFVAEVTKHLHPVKGVPVINGCPDDLVVDVVRILIDQGRADVTGRLADNLPPEKLITLSARLTVSENIQVGYQMKKTSLIAKVLAANTDPHLIELLDECIRRSYYQLVADVVQAMDSRRMIAILDRLPMDKDRKIRFLARLSRHLSPEKSGEIVNLCPNAFIADVVCYLIDQGDTDITGHFADTLSKEKLVAVSGLLTVDQVVEVGYHMTRRDLIAGVMAGYPDDYLVDLFTVASKKGYHPLTADVIKRMDWERTRRVAKGLSVEEIVALINVNDSPNLSALIQDTDPKLIRSFTRTLTPEKIAELVEQTPPWLLNTLWPYFEDETILATLPLIDLGKLPALWNHLDPQVQASLIGLSRRYQPLAAKVKTLTD